MSNSTMFVLSPISRRRALPCEPGLASPEPMPPPSCHPDTPPPPAKELLVERVTLVGLVVEELQTMQAVYRWRAHREAGASDRSTPAAYMA